MAVRVVVTGDIMAALMGGMDNDNDNDNGDSNKTDNGGDDFEADAQDPSADDPPSGVDVDTADGSVGNDMTAGFDDYGSATGDRTDSANTDWSAPNATTDWTDPNATTDWTDSNASITDPDADPIDANPTPSIFDTGADFVNSDSLSFDATSMDPAASTSYRTPGIYSIADTSYVAPRFSSTSLDITTNDPNMYYANPGSPTYSQGDQTAILEYDNAQDQLENTQANLWNSEERLDGAIDQGGDDPMEGETRGLYGRAG
jgi:hypothetical protein